MIIEQNLSATRVRHFSDAGMMIRQIETGILYEDAEDKLPCRYTYEETDIPIPAEGADYIEAAKILLGVSE